ncbi:hypothetical protein [Merismopedia glauca]|uniref:Uncharacterized protein n=1 Tax=Merismopedia glauca CCAP 1448/3 TaxID=1296344 RepID=A0A2T1BYD3_9CYAN|nr:hypothetical protein [Merismopedia glauca]PSB01019.1 hypothetical protein C7B64_20440 [Merismopedia glauca CCAP 1448/3]
MAIRKMVLTACVACLSTLTIVNDASAQAYDPELRAILRERGETISEIDDTIDRIDPYEAQKRQEALISSCYQGNSYACTEYELLNRQLQRQHQYNLDRFRSYNY